MISDRVLGSIILIVCILAIIGYTWLLFLGPETWTVLGVVLNVRWLAIAITVWLAVILILGIGAWIGYTMATTPPPTLPEEIKPEEKKEEEKEEKT
jgi:predicted DNA-binding transcriptional regulator